MSTVDLTTGQHLIVWVAQYLLYVMCGGFAAVWLFAENARGRIELLVQAVIGLVLCGVFIYVAGHLHDDPRPFVQNPSLTPLFPHAPDNGFPSDHSVAAGLIATVILVRHRIAGAVLWVCAAGIAASRVAAHVHHVQDVVAGLLLGALAAALGILVARLLLARLPWTGVDTGRHHGG